MIYSQRAKLVFAEQLEYPMTLTTANAVFHGKVGDYLVSDIDTELLKCIIPKDEFEVEFEPTYSQEDSFSIEVGNKSASIRLGDTGLRFTVTY